MTATVAIYLATFAIVAGSPWLGIIAMVLMVAAICGEIGEDEKHDD